MREKSNIAPADPDKLVEMLAYLASAMVGMGLLGHGKAWLNLDIPLKDDNGRPSD